MSKYKQLPLRDKDILEVGLTKPEVFDKLDAKFIV